MFCKTNMSATHLYRKLKQITGRSTKELIIDYRLQKAALLIKSKRFNVTETMYAVGFSSLSAFSKSFKNKYGVSPGKYGNKEE
ncbi:MAG TPA: helix-turn-helix transcriptional regulator [Marinilabiliaceae bacterium]|nr:helix-turn-helix transcriptional regulator [Marinilabiliaceae bacterium]